MRTGASPPPCPRLLTLQLALGHDDIGAAIDPAHQIDRVMLYARFHARTRNLSTATQYRVGVGQGVYINLVQSL